MLLDYAPFPRNRIAAKKSLLLTACFFILFVFIPQNAYPEDSPLAPHLLKPEAYSETYHLVLELEENVHIQIQLAITNIGIGDQFSMCRALFIDEKETWNDERVFDRSGWEYKPPGDLKIGNCLISAKEKSISIVAEVDNLNVDVQLSRGFRPVKPPGHLIEAGKHFFDLQILMPWSPAEVRFDLRGQAERSINGYGSMYRFWVTAWPADLARQWVRVFALDNDGAFILMSHYPPKKDLAATGSVWIPGAPGPVALDSMHMEINSAGNKTLSIMSSKTISRLSLQKELYRHAPLENLGFLGSIIRVFIGNWVTRTYRALLEIEGHDGPIPAVVEITSDESGRPAKKGL